MDQLQQNAMMDWLANLPDEHFINFFYELRRRREASWPQPATERYAIVILNLAEDGEWEFDLIAPPHIQCRADDDLPSGQFRTAGVCARCGFHWWSWSRAPECAACGALLTPSQPIAEA